MVCLCCIRNQLGCWPCPLRSRGLVAMAIEGEAAAPWLTGDTEVNQWLFEECDDMCRLNLSALPEPSRRSKAWATMQKHKAGKLTGSPSAYIMGILRREADGPYGRAGAAPQQQ